MVLVSATAFGTLAIFAKLAYAQGLGTEQTLAIRFVIAAVGMWVLALVLRQSPLRFRRNRLLALLAVGAVIYTGQSLTFFTALRTLPASLCVLIVYIYPSLVVLAGRIFLRRPISIGVGVALMASFVGVALLVGGARFQVAWGLAFAVLSPMIYTAYILIGERVMGGVPAVGASAAIMSGTAIAFCALAGLEGQLRLPVTAIGWAVAVGIAVFPTMIAISFFMAGLPRVGASRAALLSTWEPVVTVLLAVLLLGDRFSIVQGAGGVLVILAVLVVQGAHTRGATGPRAVR